MRRRHYEFEMIEIALALAIVVLAVILFFRSGSLTILFPIVFGLGAVLSILYGLEGILYNRNRVVRKSRIVVFGIIAAVLILFTVLSAMTIL